MLTPGQTVLGTGGGRGPGCAFVYTQPLVQGPGRRKCPAVDALQGAEGTQDSKSQHGQTGQGKDTWPPSRLISCDACVMRGSVWQAVLP